MPFLMPLLPYAAAALVALGALTWLHHEWTAPYEKVIASRDKTIADFKTAIAERAKIEGEDRRRAEANATKAEELQNELDRIVKEASPSACKLSAGDLERLRQLSDGRKRTGASKPAVPSRPR